MKRLAIVVLVLGCGSSESGGSTSDVDSAVATDTATTVDDTGSTTTDSTTPPDDTMTASETSPSDAPADMGVTFGPYPAGPYGNKVGDTFQNLKWEGYVNVLADAISNTKPYVASVDFDTLRRDAKKGYALVHVSEFF